MGVLLWRRIIVTKEQNAFNTKLLDELLTLLSKREKEAFLIGFDLRLQLIFDSKTKEKRAKIIYD